MSQPHTADAPVISDKGGDTQGLAAAQQLSAGMQHPGEIPVTGNNLASVNVERQTSGDNTLTRFPNGVKYDTGDGATALTPPPGGHFGEDAHHNEIVYDKNNKAVAQRDTDGTLHVHTKNGEYTETKDGKLTFTPSGATSDLSTLHKPGAIPHNKIEDYGVSTDGKVTRYPNGVEYDPKANKVTIPSEYPNFNHTDSKDASGNPVQQGFDGNGKLLYTLDKTGMHVPTADGTISQNHSGAMHFDSNSTQHSAVLPNVEIHDDKKKASDPLGPECMQSHDPLCGLDLGKF